MSNAVHKLVAVVFVACSGCVPGLAPVTNPPPIAIATSVPLDGVAEHIHIHNISDTNLKNVVVVGKRISDSTTGSTPAIPDFPPATILDIPWTSFGTWTPEPGDTIEVYADGFPDPVSSMISTDERAAELGFPRRKKSGN